MKHGIYYAYWEDAWQADYIPYIRKVASLGFDLLEIGAAALPNYTDQKMAQIKDCAAECGITLTCGYGPRKDQNLASPDSAVRNNAKSFFTDLMQRMEKMDIHLIGGGLYSYWPVDYSDPLDKAADWSRSVEGVAEMAKVAADCGIDFCLEVLNRFEGYILNTAAEAVRFVEEVDHPRVKIHLDTFHMNIEEDSIGGAIRRAGRHLGHLHTGECNRRVPGQGRIPWREVGEALRDIGYDGAIVMEPFVRMGGKVGDDIKIWRELASSDPTILDREAQCALEFQRYMLG